MQNKIGQSDVIEQVKAFDWMTGPDEDSWLPVQCFARLRGVTKIVLTLFLPNTSDMQPKTIRATLDDQPITTRRVFRGQLNEIIIEYVEPRSGVLMLEFSDREQAPGDARDLGAVCVSLATEPVTVARDVPNTTRMHARAIAAPAVPAPANMPIKDYSKLVDTKKIRILEKSKLLDSEWYLRQYPDVRESGFTSAQHYLFVGSKLGRQPSPRFDPAYYLRQHSDVRNAGLDPTFHYIQYGRAEGRSVAPPAVDIAQKPASKEIVRRAGRQMRQDGRKTVLLCAHVVGNELFGSERSLLDMQDALVDLGYNVVVAVPSLRNSEYIRLLSAKSVAICALEYGWWRNGSKPSENAIANFAKIIADERIDFVHANTIMLREPLIAAGRMGVRRVLHARELIRNDEGIAQYIGLSPDAIVDLVWENTDVLLANSRATAECFEKAGRPISLVYNTADIADLMTVPGPCTDEAFKVGLISSNVAKKGLEDFVEIAKIVATQNPDIRFRLIGPKNELTKSIEGRIAAGELPPSLEIVGYRNTPAEAMADLDLVLSLSKFDESFGRTVLEAMAAARPVIVYARGAPPEMVIDGQTGFIAPKDDVGAVAEKVLELAADRSRSMLMGLEGQQRATSVFGHTAYRDAMRAAYGLLEAAEVPDFSKKLVLRRRTEVPELQLSELKLAYFCWHFPVPSETFVLNELRILKERGVDVIVFCKQSPHKDFQPDFDIEWRKVNDSSDLAAKLLETGRNMVHAHFVYPTVTDMVWPACEKVQIPFTCIAHAQDIFRWSNATRNRIDEFSRSPFCKQIFTLSQYHRDYLINRDVPLEKITINSNCVDPKLFAAGQVSDRSARKTRRISAVARFTAKKGLDLLILAAKSLEEEGIEVDIYGYGELEDKFGELIRERDIKNVRLRGPVNSREELLSIFRKSDLFVCPSVRALDGDMDGLPTTILEAISARLPVLATDISGISDLLIDGVTGLVCDASPSSIVQKVREFYSMSDVQVDNLLEDAEARLRLNHDGNFLINTLLRFWQGRTVDFGLVVWNNRRELQEIIARLYRYTDLPFHLVICDNGSGPETLADLLKIYAQHDNFTLILNRENSFVGPGTNICLEQSSSDYFIYICGKEGIVTKPGWEKGYVRTFDENPRYGQVGTFCYSPSYLRGREYPNAIELFDKFRNKHFATDNPDREFRHVQGGFFGIRRAMINEIGGLSDEVPHSYTDVEFSFYVESCGWELGEVPETMALFNKTRPGLRHRVNDTHSALHPPMLTDLDWLGRIARQEVHHCNVCGNQVPLSEAETDRQCCRECGATPRVRSIFRALVETTLLYRRLPAFGINVPDALQRFWRQQFQGVVTETEILTEKFRADGRLENRTAGLQLGLINELPAASSDADIIRRETARLLRPGAQLFLCGPVSEATWNVLRGTPFQQRGVVRYSAAATRFDHLPIYLLERNAS